MVKLIPVTQDAGFTLIEVLTVVAVIGILVAIAVPNYQDYLLRTKLVDAGSSLAQLRVRLEQYYQDNRSYAAGDVCGVPVADSNGKYFTFTCATRDEGQEFTVTATGTAAGGTSEFAYTVDQSNNRETTALPDGWASDTGCWIIAKGQKCK
jgi:type IV pilus assembly protein PilE